MIDVTNHEIEIYKARHISWLDFVRAYDSIIEYEYLQDSRLDYDIEKEDIISMYPDGKAFCIVREIQYSGIWFSLNNKIILLVRVGM